MKKVLISFLAIVCALCCSFGFAACDNDEAAPTPTPTPTAHTHDYQWVDNGDGTHKQHCAKDGCDAPDINSENHVWGANDKCEKCPALKPAAGHSHDYKWVDNGNGTHRQHCQNDGCNAPDINSGNHVWGANDKCEKCPALKPAAEHTHDYKWVNNWDGTHKQHCQNVGCDAPDINEGGHTYVKEPFSSRCDKCGDFEAPEGHTHDYQWKDDGSGSHSLVCQSEGCNYPNPSFATTEEHTWGENGICDKCHAVSLQLHKHTVSTEYYCQGDVNHFQRCDSCNSAVTFGDHKYPSDGAACSFCGHKQTTTFTNFTFELNEDGKSYSITKFKDTFGNVANVVIPCEHYGRPVTSISADAFKNSNITSVEILDCCIGGYKLTSGVTSIENGAFSGCSKLKSVIIPKSVTEIGFGAFKGCSAMTDLTVPFVGRNKVAEGEAEYTDYGVLGYIFGGDNWHNNSQCVPATLKTVTVTDSTVITPYAFRGCKIENLTLPDGLKAIGDWVFCSTLKSVNIPDGVTSIGVNAFYGSAITSIALPNGVQAITASTFQDCSELAEITIGGTITSIGTNAFKNCDKLKKVNYKGDLASWCGGISGLDELMNSYPALYINNQLLSGEITIPDSVNCIVNSAFHGCSEITQIIIHGGVSSIGNNAFGGCSKLRSITVDAGNATYASQDGILYNKAKTSCIHIPLDIGGEITVPYGITSINLSGTKITTVHLPNSITSISSNAFSWCTGLINITIPDSVTSIGSDAFSGCTSLTSIIIPEGVESIEGDAFNGCTSLASITISDSVTSIGFNAFYDTAWYNNQQSGVVYAGKVAYKYKGSIPDGTYTSVTLKEGTTGIADRAFADFTGLNGITIPDSVMSIGAMAFTSCENLRVITYKGTKAQWEEISKSNVWDAGMSSYFISCADGTIINN